MEADTRIHGGGGAPPPAAIHASTAPSDLDRAIAAADTPVVRALLQEGKPCSFPLDEPHVGDVDAPAGGDGGAGAGSRGAGAGASPAPSPLAAVLGDYVYSPHYYGDLGHRACVIGGAAAEKAVCKIAGAAASAAHLRDPVDVASFLGAFWATPDVNGTPLLLRAAQFATARTTVVSATATRATTAAMGGDVGGAAFTDNSADAGDYFRNFDVTVASPLFDTLLRVGDGVFSAAVPGEAPLVTRLRDADGRNLLHVLLAGGGRAPYNLLRHFAGTCEDATRTLLAQADSRGATPLHAAAGAGAADALFGMLHVLLCKDSDRYDNSVSAAARAPAAELEATGTTTAYTLEQLTVLPRRYYEWWVRSHNLLHAALRAGDLATFSRLFALVDCDAAVREQDLGGGGSGGATLLDALAAAPRAHDAADEGARVAVASFLLGCPSFAPAAAYTPGDLAVAEAARTGRATALADVLGRVLSARKQALDIVVDGFVRECRASSRTPQALQEPSLRAQPFRGALARALQASPAHGWAAVDELAGRTVGGVQAVWTALGKQWAVALRAQAPSSDRTLYVNSVARAPDEHTATIARCLGDAFKAVASAARDVPAQPPVLPSDPRKMFVAYFTEFFFTQAYGVMRAIATGKYVRAGSQTSDASAAATTALTSALAWGGFGIASGAVAACSVVGRGLLDWYSGADQLTQARHFCALFEGMSTTDVLRLVIGGGEAIAAAYRDFLGFIRADDVASFAAVCVHSLADYMARSSSFEPTAGKDVNDVAAMYKTSGVLGMAAGGRLGRWAAHQLTEAKVSLGNLVHGTDVAAPPAVRRLSQLSFVAPLRRKDARRIDDPTFITTFSTASERAAGVEVYTMLQRAATLDPASGTLYAPPGTSELRALSYRIVVGTAAEAAWKGQVPVALSRGSNTADVVNDLLKEEEVAASSVATATPVLTVPPATPVAPAAAGATRATTAAGAAPSALPPLPSPAIEAWAGHARWRTSVPPAATRALPANDYLAACASAAALDSAAESGCLFRMDDLTLHPLVVRRLRWFSAVFVETFFNTHYFVVKALADGEVERKRSDAQRVAQAAAAAAPAAAAGGATAMGATPEQARTATTGAIMASAVMQAVAWFGSYVENRRDKLKIEHFRQLFKDFDFREVVALIQAFAEHIAVKFHDPLSRVDMERADGGVIAVAHVAAMRVFEHILRKDHREAATVESLAGYLSRQVRNRALGQVTPPVATEMQPFFAVLEAGLIADGGVQGDERGSAFGRTLRFYLGGEKKDGDKGGDILGGGKGGARWHTAPPAAVFLHCGLRTLGAKPVYYARRSGPVLGHRLGTAAEAGRLSMREVGFAAPPAADLLLPPLARAVPAPRREDVVTLEVAEAARLHAGIGRFAVGSSRIAGAKAWAQHALPLDAETGKRARAAYVKTVLAASYNGGSSGGSDTERAAAVITVDAGGTVLIDLDGWTAAVGRTVAAGMTWRLAGDHNGVDGSVGGSMPTAQVWATLLAPAYSRALALVPPTLAVGLSQPPASPGGRPAPRNEPGVSSSATLTLQSQPQQPPAAPTEGAQHELSAQLLELAGHSWDVAHQRGPGAQPAAGIPPALNCLRIAAELEPRSCCKCAVHAEVCLQLARVWTATRGAGGDVNVRLSVTLHGAAVAQPADLFDRALRILREPAHADPASARLRAAAAVAVADAVTKVLPQRRLHLLYEASEADPSLSHVWLALAREPSEKAQQAAHLKRALAADPGNVDALLLQLQTGGQGSVESLAQLFESRRVAPSVVADLVRRVAQQGPPAAHARTAPSGCALPVTTPTIVATLRRLAAALLRCVAGADAGSADDAHAEAVVRLLGGYEETPPAPFLLLGSSLRGEDIPEKLSNVGRAHADALVLLSAEAAFTRALRHVLPRSVAADGVAFALPPDVNPFWPASSDSAGVILDSSCVTSLASTAAGGHRKVLRVPLPDAGCAVWLKEWPDFPGLEAAARLLTRRLFGGVLPGFGTLWGMPPSAVFVTDGGKPYSVTLEASGVSLRSMLDCSDAGTPPSSTCGSLPPLDARTTAAMQLASLLLCAIDGRADNIVVRPPPGGGADAAAHVLSFDNDLCMFPHAPADPEGIHLGSALLCFGNMLAPIPGEVRAALLAADADTTVREWVGELKSYDDALKAALPPTDKLAAEARAADAYPYVPLTVMMARGVRGRLLALQRLLRSQADATPMDALEILYAGIAPLFRASSLRTRSGCARRACCGGTKRTCCRRRARVLRRRWTSC
jgi:hypothetical protein